MPTQPRSQCFFPNLKRLVGEESRSIALHQKRSPGNKVDTHKDQVKLSAMCKCIQKCSALLKWDLLIQKIQPLVYRKKLILICELGCVQGIMHFIIQSALLDCSFPILVCYIRLVYRMSNFQTAAIVLTSFVKDTFCLQLHQSNSKFMWLASKKRTKVLGIGNSFLYQYFIL